MTRQEWTPNSTQMAAMEAFAACLYYPNMGGLAANRPKKEFAQELEERIRQR